MRSGPANETLLRLRHQIVSLQLSIKLLRLRLALRAYDPNQPRVPAGNPNGGQWTSDDPEDVDATGSTGRRRIAQGNAQRRYTVDLAEEEARGGHTIRDHVGKSDKELLARVLADRGGGGLYSFARKRQGSFPSLETANDLVNRTVESNRQEVDRVAGGKQDEAFLKMRFGYVTGREAFAPDAYSAPYLRDTYEVGVLIRHDPQASSGYRVHTAYPRNESPR